MQGEAIKRIQHCCISSDTDSQKSFPRRVSAVNCVGELTFANIHPPETKCQDSDFPLAELEQLGYHVAKAGQKSYNGEGRCVAVCCSVLQCVAVCCSVLQCVAVCCSVLQGVECAASVSLPFGMCSSTQMSTKKHTQKERDTKDTTVLLYKGDASVLP